jgi:hypothetical protein
VNGSKLFFLPTLTSALFALEINEREQIADYEPMASGVNKPVVDRLKTIAWNKYPYSLILIPGAGPDVKDMPMSAEGMMRCRVAQLDISKEKLLSLLFLEESSSLQNAL